MEQLDTIPQENHKVLSIKKIKEKYDVYDIEVPETHNFVADGVVVHNSHLRSSFEYFADNEPDGEQGDGEAHAGRAGARAIVGGERAADWGRTAAADAGA